MLKLSEWKPQYEEILDRLDRLEGSLYRGTVSPEIHVTAQNISVSALSAISANMGTITSGTIIGGTIKTSSTTGTGTNGQGILLNASYLRAYDSVGAMQFEIDAATGVARTGTTAPYAKFSDDGLDIYNSQSSSAGIHFHDSISLTNTEMRECNSGIAISSDTGAVVFRMFDTEYGPMANRRLALEFGSNGDGMMAWYDDAGDMTLYLAVNHGTGDLLLDCVDSGNLVLHAEAGAVVVNEDGKSTCDFRVEGDTNESLLFADASADRIGIGINNPSGLVELAAITADGGKGLVLTSTADTDDDTVYGLYGTVGAGAGTPATADRLAYGAYMTVAPATGEDTYAGRVSGYAALLAPVAASSTYTTGFDSVSTPSGVSFIYHFKVADNARASAGGSQWGLYIDLDAADTDNYGVYEVGGALNYFAGNVGLGTQAPANQLNLNTPATTDATADAIFQASTATQTPLVIMGAAAQSANLLELVNSGGTAQATIDQMGSYAIALNSFSTTTPCFSGERTYTFTTGTGRAFNFTAYHNSGDAAVATCAGAAFDCRHLGSGNLSNLYGFSAGTNLRGAGNITTRTVAVSASIGSQDTKTGTVSNAYLIYGEALDFNDHTVTNLYGISLPTPTVHGGVTATITTAYGLYINDWNAATTNYAILTNAGNIVFNEGGDSASDLRVEGDNNANLLFTDASADKVGICDGAPGEVLDVTGNINATGVYKIDDVQVVSNRVIDARCDDVINSGDATTDGVIDSLRDALIAHGLIAAA